MEKINNAKDVIKSVYYHFKKNSVVYTLLGILAYLLYKVYKIVSDNGLKDGEPYYKDFEDPEDKELSE